MAKFPRFVPLFIAALVVLHGCAVTRMDPDLRVLENAINGVEEADPAQKYCVEHLRQAHGLDVPLLQQVLQQETAKYQSLVEQALIYREKTIAVAHRLRDKVAANLPLSGADLDVLNSGTAAHLELREALMGLAQAHECWADLPAARLGGVGNRLHGLMLSLSAALVLYDNYLLAVSVFENNAKLRRTINDGDKGYQLDEEKLSGVSLEYYSVYKRRRVQKAIRFFDQQIEKLPAVSRAGQSLAYLETLIRQSPSYNLTKSYSPLYAMGRKLNMFGLVSGDMMVRLGREGSNLFSRLFGNMVGLIETRKGKLYHDSEAMPAVRKTLRAGDILLEKTPFRLTDKFIPGHWGHAALWIGTEAELKQLGLWQHPLVQPHHEQIRRGHSVLEALRGGVQLSSLSHFMNVDDLAVLRDNRLNNEMLAELGLLSFRQWGKEYDFNFDVETSDRIVCSELIYLTHVHSSWPTENTLGRITISPDNIAVKTLEANGLDLVLLFHDGKAVKDAPRDKMRELLSLDFQTPGHESAVLAEPGPGLTDLVSGGTQADNRQ